MLKSIINIFVLLSIFSCSDTKDIVCFSFDERQCQIDPWSSADSNTSVEDIKSYLSTEGVEVEGINIDRAFHEVTCLACEVCPTSSRFYISIEEQYEAQLSKLSLLALAKTDCSN